MCIAFPRGLVLALIVPAVLAACDRRPPECRTRTVAEIATIDRLIAETEGNLARGFSRGSAGPAPTVSTSLCLGSGSGHVGMSFCSGGGGRAVRTGPAAIDPAAERAKLDSLRQSRARLLAADPNGPALCTVALAGR